MSKARRTDRQLSLREKILVQKAVVWSMERFKISPLESLGVLKDLQKLYNSCAKAVLDAEEKRS